MRQLKARIAKLEKWLDEETANENIPTLSDVIDNILSKQGQSRIVRLKNASKMLIFLQENKIENLEDLEQKVKVMENKTYSVHEELKKTDRRIKTLNEHIRQSEYYKVGRKYKRQYDKLYSEYEASKSSKNFLTKHKTQKALDKANAYYEANRAELSLYEAADKYLQKVMQKHFDPSKLPPITQWKKELTEKTAVKSNLSEEYNTLKEETKKIERIQRSVKEILRSEEQQEIKPNHRKLDIEL